MLVPRKVATQEKDTFELIFVGLTVKVSFFFTKNVVPCFSLVFAKFVQTTCFRMIFLAAKHIANTGVCFLFAGCVVYDEVDQRGLKCSLWCWRPEWKFRFFFQQVSKCSGGVVDHWSLTFWCLKGDRSSCLCFVVVYWNESERNPLCSCLNRVFSRLEWIYFAAKTNQTSWCIGSQREVRRRRA